MTTTTAPERITNLDDLHPGGYYAHQGRAFRFMGVAVAWWEQATPRLGIFLSAEEAPTVQQVLFGSDPVDAETVEEMFLGAFDVVDERLIESGDVVILPWRAR